jgi:dTMP kinase
MAPARAGERRPARLAGTPPANRPGIRYNAGMFFSFDGADGVGKSTQIPLFCDWLRELGHAVVACRDPGSTPLGEAVRNLLLHATDTPIGRPAEMLLYMAARAQLVDQVIEPALAAGQVVVSDRYLLANVVYQGHAGGLDPAQVWQVGRVATRTVLPDVTFVLDMPVEAAAGRLRRDLDRMERQGDDFRKRLRQGFLDEAARIPDRIVVIDAGQPIERVQASIRQAALSRLPALAGEPAALEDDA